MPYSPKRGWRRRSSPVALVLAASGLGVIGLQLAVQAFGEFALVARQPVGVCVLDVALD